jgi:hypothetical protein
VLSDITLSANIFSGTNALPVNAKSKTNVVTAISVSTIGSRPAIAFPLSLLIFAAPVSWTGHRWVGGCM